MPTPKFEIKCINCGGSEIEIYSNSGSGCQSCAMPVVVLRCMKCGVGEQQ